jgi:hypothetical protein
MLKVFPEFDHERTAMDRPQNLAALAAALLLITTTAFAQDKSLQRFPLHKPIPESGVTACRSAATPIKLNMLMSEGKDNEASSAFESAVTAGECLNGAGMVTYLRQVHRVDSPDGAVLTVYEARAGGVRFFVPMLGYLHQEISA